MNFKKISTTVFAAVVIGASGAAGAAVNLTFDPSAGNNDAANKTVFAGQGAFTFNSIQTTLGSMLDINAASGSGVGWQESGHLIFNTYDSGSQRQGNRTFAGGDYDVYGIFTGSGVGNWAANDFTVTGINNFAIKVYGSPNTGTALTISTPTIGTQVNGGITGGNKDFLLGTATFSGSFGGTAAQLGALGVASTQLTASFNFVPASADYVGAGGFFRAPVPFQLNLQASGSSNIGQTTFTTDASGVHIRTAFNNGATGNIRALNVIPEPGALSLAGLALLAAGAISRKKRVKLN